MAATQTVQDVMTPDPVTVSANAPLLNVARRMRDSDIGDVIGMKDGYVCGIVTDRDETSVLAKISDAPANR